MDIKVNYTLTKLMNKLKSYADKNVIVAYSGGYDSATLLYLLCKAGAKVTALTMDTGTLPGQEAESLIRKHQLAHLSKRSTVESATISVSLDGCYRLLNHGWRFAQMVYWNTLLSLVTPKTADYVLIGNIMGDPEVSMIPELIRAWEARKPFWANSNYPKLEFPLAKVHKFEMVDLALTLYGNEYLEFIRYSHSCSIPIPFLGDLYLECADCLNCSSTKYDIYQKFGSSLQKTRENLGNVFKDPEALAIEYGLTITAYNTENNNKTFTYVLSDSKGSYKVITACWEGWVNYFHSLLNEPFPDAAQDGKVQSSTISYDLETSRFTKSHCYVKREDIPKEK